MEEGKFTLIIVVDEINDELRRIIRYVNECSKSSFSLHALEMRRFRAGGVEILVPQLYGLSVKPRASTEKRRKWTKEEFLVAFRSNVEPNAAVIVENLYEWAEDTADRVWLGSGTETGSFSFHYLKDGRTLPVFSAYTNGRLSLNYGGLSEQVGNKEVLEEFHRRITEIPTFRGIPADFSRWPSVRSAEVFRDPEALTLEAFKQVVEWFGSTVKAA
ncbi:MAG: hypothetical protein H5T59_05820 [Anaerolineae bacterium]|nr:hypothetical protein [Anaerolineae bacterium]